MSAPEKTLDRLDAVENRVQDISELTSELLELLGKRIEQKEVEVDKRLAGLEAFSKTITSALKRLQRFDELFTFDKTQGGN